MLERLPLAPALAATAALLGACAHPHASSTPHEAADQTTRPVQNADRVAPDHAATVPLSMNLVSMGEQQGDDRHQVREGAIVAVVDLNAGPGAGALWFLDFRSGQLTYRCVPVVSVVDGAAPDRVRLELRCEAFKALNGSERGVLWPGDYMVQIRVEEPRSSGAWVNQIPITVRGTRATPPGKLSAKGNVGIPVRVVDGKIIQRTIAQGVRARPGVPQPVATNVNFQFEIDNRRGERLRFIDWELFVVDAAGHALSWDAIPVEPANWDGSVPAGQKLRVTLVDGVFPPALQATRGLRLTLRLRTAAGKTAWIGTGPMNVGHAAPDHSGPPRP